jgi:hypothetical protein
MARKGGSDSSSSSQPVTQGNGGIMGSGVFGNFGSFVNCKSEDNSMYCNFVKFFNILIMLLVIIAIVYFAYKFGSAYFGKKK